MFSNLEKIFKFIKPKNLGLYNIIIKIIKLLNSLWAVSYNYKRYDNEKNAKKLCTF